MHGTFKSLIEGGTSRLNTCNIQIYFCNIYMKHMQHSENLYCNIVRYLLQHDHRYSPQPWDIFNLHELPAMDAARSSSVGLCGGTCGERRPTFGKLGHARTRLHLELLQGSRPPPPVVSAGVLPGLAAALMCHHPEALTTNRVGLPAGLKLCGGSGGGATPGAG